MKKYYSILNEVSLFRGIQAEKIVDILVCLHGNVKKYKKNQPVILSGNPVPSLGIVLEGSGHIIREDIMGNRMLVTDLKAGDVFGETFACAGVKESPVSVYATEYSEILWISIQRIVSPCDTVCDFHSLIVTNLLQILATKNLYLNQKMELLSKRTIREKVLAFLISEAQKNHASSFKIALNRNELADFLCIDRSAMSREMARLKEEGVINYNKNQFQILKNLQGIPEDGIY
jgi:CRP-like cAMP-binding protein